MTRGAVYWHFDGKPAMLVALINHFDQLQDQVVESQIPAIKTIEDLRRAFILYAQAMAQSPVFRKFEFFLTYQMEWSEELLKETHRTLNELRGNPLDDFRSYFQLPEIRSKLKEDTDIDLLVLTLTSFWFGVCKLYLGRYFFTLESSPVGAGERPALSEIDFGKTVEAGFDMILRGVLNEECGDE